MSLFGWSYPPGCSGPPDEYEGPCELCGHEVDDCICPACTVCGAQGDPCCYSRHGMVLNEQQTDGQAAALRREQENADACAAEALGEPAAATLGS